MSVSLESLKEKINQCTMDGGDWIAGDHISEAETATLIPYAIVTFMSHQDKGKELIGLTSTFVARRSLACWFNYCDDRSPLLLADRIISAIVKHTPGAVKEDDTTPCFPTEQGMPITDCRQADTMLSSEAVAYAAAYHLTGKAELAVYSLSDAIEAFNESPLGTEEFEEEMLDWIMTYAIPGALEFRDLTIEEQEAMCSFNPTLLRGLKR